MDTLPPILLIMMICWTRAFGSVMMFRSAVSDLVDRRFLRRGGILRWIHVTRPATETSAHRCFHDQRRMNGKETWIQEKKHLIWATISTWHGAHGGPLYPSPCFPAIPPFMARGSI
ncbi:hypothetical protein K456DRAFT_1675074 [Colletotrichum gloeosporioides 23]|nr:hypothetical protein K456DRAFT_1675074 [Colletotrichum gloeosporioides 23]